MIIDTKNPLTKYENSTIEYNLPIYGSGVESPLFRDFKISSQ